MPWSRLHDTRAPAWGRGKSRRCRFAAQGRKEPTIGTLPCDTITFGVLVLGTVLLVATLCFLPALALGPVAEQLQP